MRHAALPASARRRSALARLRAAPALAALALAAAAPSARAGGPEVIASFDDAADDASGPGSYVPPTDGDFRDGDFDLRRFTVLVDGDDVLFEVTLGAIIRKPEVTQRSNSSEIQLWNGIYLQNIDIYIDTDRTPGSGSDACIPGRRVAFEGGRTWEAAVVLTPQPGPARSITASVLGKAAEHVIFAEHLQSAGRTVTARVPAIALGGRPRPDWGYSVHVSGAAWERSFAVLDRIRGGTEPNAFTLPILTVPDTWAFGGAPDNNVFPRVLDVLLPPGADQRAVLSSYDVAAGTFARVPFIEAGQTRLLPVVPVLARAPAPTAQPQTASPAQAAAPSPPPKLALAGPPKLDLNLAPKPAKPSKPGLELTVAYIAGNMVSISGPAQGLKTMQFGDVLGADGIPVAKVVIVQILEGGIVASAVENRDKITPRARVRFEAP